MASNSTLLSSVGANLVLHKPSRLLTFLNLAVGNSRLYRPLIISQVLGWVAHHSRGRNRYGVNLSNILCNCRLIAVAIHFPAGDNGCQAPESLRITDKNDRVTQQSLSLLLLWARTESMVVC